MIVITDCYAASIHDTSSQKQNMRIFFGSKELWVFLYKKLTIIYFKPNKITLYFSGLVDNDKIKDYAEHREKMLKKGRGAPFNNAVKQMEEYMSNRVVRFFYFIIQFFQWSEFFIFYSLQMYRNNACPTIENCNNKVQVKTERDIEQQLGIKVEPIPTTQAATMVTSNAKNLYQGSPSKPLIDKLLDLQKENQRHVLELKKKDIEHAEVLLKKQQTEGQLNEKLRTLSAELDELQSELSNAKTKLTEQEAKNTQTISDLNRKKTAWQWNTPTKNV